MKVNIIAAIGQGGVIGKDGSLPWYCPEDLKYFREKTMGHPVIMGRNTFESIGKPLDGRRTIVLSQSKKTFPGTITCTRLEEALHFCRYDEMAFIAGGESVYKQALEWAFADHIYLTYIDRPLDGDAYFPSLALERDWAIARRCKGFDEDVTFFKLERMPGAEGAGIEDIDDVFLNT